MAQSIKSLALKDEDLSFYSKHPEKNQGRAIYTCNPTIQEAEAGLFLGLSDSSF